MIFSLFLFYNSMKDVAKILLVEDNEMNRDMLARRLKRKGFDVEVAVDGRECLELATELYMEIDLVLMDLSLPVIDGWTATRTMKDSEILSMIPIIILTAHAMKGDRERAEAAGCDDFDTKPVDFKRLLRKIRALL